MTMGHSWKIVFGLALLIACVLGVAATRAGSDYIVRADDRLKIKIFQYPELSDEYTVSANGTISIAAIGDIPVDGLSTKEVAKRISEELVRAGLSEKPGTSVDILQSRPVYVLGDVQKPGEYPFRPGVTVLQVVSLAGGWLRFNDPGLMQLDRDAINIKGDMRSLVSKYYQLVARRARLNAELVMQDDVKFPAELTQKAQSDPALTQLLDEERSLLSIHVDAERGQLDSLEKDRDIYQKEIEAISRQIQASKTQYDSVGAELQGVKDLVKRGYSTVTREMGLERMQAQIEMNEQGFQTLILRSRQSISDVDQKIFDLKSKQNATLTSQLQEARLDLDDVRSKFETSQSLLVEAQVTVPTLVGNSDGVVEGRSLTVVRVQDGKTRTIDADEQTELLPGDVVRVQRNILPSPFGSLQQLGTHNAITPVAGKD